MTTLYWFASIYHAQKQGGEMEYDPDRQTMGFGQIT